MKLFDVIAEGHEGVFSVPEEKLGSVYAENEKQAIEIFSKEDMGFSRIICYGDYYKIRARTIFAKEVI